MPQPSPQNPYRAPALEKGLDILEHLAGRRTAVSQADLAAELGRAPSEIYRMLMCLENRGYVSREAESGKFRLTLRIYELGHQMNALAMLREAARFPMEVLAGETGQSCHLSIRNGDRLLVLMERMPAKRICLAVGEGTVLSLTQTTSGKVMLSRLGDGVVEGMLEGDAYFQSLPPKKRRDLQQGIATARRQGCLVSPSDFTEGVADIAFPVGVAGTDTAAVLALSQVLGPQSGETETNLDATRRAAARINQNLGISPG